MMIYGPLVWALGMEPSTGRLAAALPGYSGRPPPDTLWPASSPALSPPRGLGNTCVPLSSHVGMTPASHRSEPAHAPAMLAQWLNKWSVVLVPHCWDQPGDQAQGRCPLWGGIARPPQTQARLIRMVTSEQHTHSQGRPAQSHMLAEAAPAFSLRKICQILTGWNTCLY